MRRCRTIAWGRTQYHSICCAAFAETWTQATDPPTRIKATRSVLHARCLLYTSHGKPPLRKTELQITFSTMPPKKGDAFWAHMEDLSTEYRIDFPGEVEPSQWPNCHRTTLEKVRQLGGNTYDVYATASGVLESEPWKVKVKSMADFLVDTASRCRQRNESSWRHACEPIILGRLSSEVCWWAFYTNKRTKRNISR